MKARTWPLAILLVSATLLAGCTSDDPPAASAPSDGGGSTPAPDPQAPAGGGGGSGSGSGSGSVPAPQTRPAAPPPVADAGEIQGEFASAWNLPVPRAGARAMTVHFNLSGIEAGVPPTARVNLVLLDPAGQAIRTGAAGLGGDGDALAWTFAAEELALPGTYVLQATAAAPTGAIPSAGLAKYQLYAWVEY